MYIHCGCSKTPTRQHLLIDNKTNISVALKRIFFFFFCFLKRKERFLFSTRGPRRVATWPSATRPDDSASLQLQRQRARRKLDHELQPWTAESEHRFLRNGETLGPNQSPAQAQSTMVMHPRAELTSAPALLTKEMARRSSRRKEEEGGRAEGWGWLTFAASTPSRWKSYVWCW
jgi:hypothetical protein